LLLVEQCDGEADVEVVGAGMSGLACGIGVGLAIDEQAGGEPPDDAQPVHQRAEGHRHRQAGGFDQQGFLALVAAVVSGLSTALLGSFVLLVGVREELVEVDWLPAGLAAAGPTLEDWLQGEHCLRECQAGRW
jgi:hypothetical protein